MNIWGRLVAGTLPLLLCVSVAFAQTEHRAALVIGNGDYLTVGKLKNPANDSTAMAAMLRRLGFEVTERENAPRRAMIQAVRSFTEKLSPGGIGLVFYAGHGIQAQGANYLVPVDAALAVEDDLKYETLDLQDILNKLDDARVRLSIVILDACRDNPFRSFRSGTHGLALINPPNGTVIAYATAPGKVAADGKGDNSVFTSELLKAMSKPDRLLDVFANVTDAVERQTGNAQTPWINSSFRGDFYFTGPTTVTITQQPDPAAAAISSEIVFWQSIASSNNPADFEAYIKQFPQGSFVALAHVRLASLSARPARPAPLPPSPAHESKRPDVKGPVASAAPFVEPKPGEAGPADGQKAAPSISAEAARAKGDEAVVRKDYAEAFRWYSQAAELGNALALKGIGGLYEKGWGVRLDYAEAMRRYRKAADQGSTVAPKDIGVLYEKGWGVSQDYGEAMRWFRKAADRGDTDALVDIGFLYEKGRGVTQNFPEAMRWYRRAADRGNAMGQYDVGLLYYNGLAGMQDYSEAMRWYIKAADQGNALAQNNIGQLYSEGSGVKQDPVEAMRWYRKAADQGNALAQFNVGRFYFEGLAGRQDYSEGMRWYLRAAEQGNARAQNNIGLLYKDGRGVTQNYGEAMRWFRKAADQDFALAQWNIARLYEDGRGVEKDPAQARVWMQKAAAGGHAEAKLWMASH
jgi:TPR repeat protein